MKSPAQIKREVFENRKPLDYHVEIERVSTNAYRVRMHYGFGDDLKRLVNAMRLEGYQVL